jgi:hypothetical protein
MSTLYVDNLQPNLGSQVEIPNLKPNSGNVIKTQLLTNTSDTNITSTSYTDAMTFTYTPALATSKIYFHCSFILRAYRDGGADGRFKYRILINGSEKLNNLYLGPYDYGGGGIWFNWKLSEIVEFDSVSTSALTFKFQTAVLGGQGIRTNENAKQSQLLVTEIAQ